MCRVSGRALTVAPNVRGSWNHVTKDEDEDEGAGLERELKRRLKQRYKAKATVDSASTHAGRYLSIARTRTDDSSPLRASLLSRPSNQALFASDCASTKPSTSKPSTMAGSSACVGSAGLVRSGVGEIEVGVSKQAPGSIGAGHSLPQEGSAPNSTSHLSTKPTQYVRSSGSAGASGEGESESVSPEAGALGAAAGGKASWRRMSDEARTRRRSQSMLALLNRVSSLKLLQMQEQSLQEQSTQPNADVDQFNARRLIKVCPLGPSASREERLAWLLRVGRKLHVWGYLDFTIPPWDYSQPAERAAIEKFGFLFDGYKVEFYYYELVEMARK